MSRFLDQMAISSAARVPRGAAALRRAAQDAPPPPPLTLNPYFIIAEVKWASPSAGVLTSPTGDQAAETAQRACCYAQAGAAAISVLTEPSRFSGSLALMQAAAAEATVPVMRKDFLIDPLQLFEARAAGAGGALLIARMLSDGQLSEMLDAAQEAGLWVLLEAFDAADLSRIQGLNPTGQILAGLNCRDLQTLQVDPDRFAALADHGPMPFPLVAESGMGSPDAVAETARLGYRGALVGSALMQAADPAAMLRDMLHAGRTACSSRSVA